MVKLVSYYIAERYPSYKEKLSSMLDKNEAEDILSSTREVYTWLKSLKA
jgi:HEPN domain-containing protein